MQDGGCLKEQSEEFPVIKPSDYALSFKNCPARIFDPYEADPVSHEKPPVKLRSGDPTVFGEAGEGVLHQTEGSPRAGRLCH